MTTQFDPTRAIKDFLICLDKEVRGIRLYKGEGPIVEQLTADLHRLGEALVAQGPITLRVVPFGLLYDGAPVTDTATRVPYLFRMYLDGVRELSFLPGLEPEEIDRLVAALPVDKSHDNDSVTSLWSAELTHIQYYAVDSFTTDISQSQQGASLAGRKARLPASGDGGDTEVALSSDDLRVLHTDDLAAWVRLAKAPTRPDPDQTKTTTAVQKAWHSAAEPARFLTIVAQATSSAKPKGSNEDPAQPEPSPMVLGVYDALVAARDVDGVASMLSQVAGPQVDDSPALKALQAALITPTRMQALAPLVDKGHTRFMPAFTHLVEPARDGLLALLTALSAGDAEVALRELLNASGMDLTPIFARRLAGSDTDDVLVAIQSLGRIATPAAIHALCDALQSTLGVVRKAALQAMAGAYDETARVALGRALRDPDKDNRLLALEILRNSGDPRVGWLLLAALQHQNFRERPADEQQALVKALAAFDHPRTTGWFADLLTHRTAMSHRNEIPLQLLAVEVMVAMGSVQAHQILKDAAGRWLIANETKEAVQAALSRWTGAT
ncbi:MAG: hypothetical protein GXP62_02095 [Oligoflexia bacterium]|nr:hypothetical protein [Oligoflexia bacterium]